MIFASSWLSILSTFQENATHFVYTCHRLSRTSVLTDDTFSSTLLFQLHVAAANGYLSVVEFLLEHHVSTDVVDNDLWQPLHAAACWGHVSIPFF